MILSLSQAGAKAIKKDEGVRLQAYTDVAGVVTIGYGHTGAEYAVSGNKISKAKADELFKKDVKFAEDAVNKLVKVDLSQNQFDALTSLVFNIGVSAFKRSTLLKKLNSGDYLGAADEFPKWRKAGGEVINGLVKRRARERAMFLDGYEVHSTDDYELESNLEPTPPKRSVSLSKPEASLTGGAVGLAGLNAVKDQIEPLTAYSETLQWIFVGISIIGVLAYMWYSRKED